jgi:hypothetical protein
MLEAAHLENFLIVLKTKRLVGKLNWIMQGGMNSTEESLLTALLDLEAAVETMKQGAKPDLASRFQRIDTLTRELPPGTDSSLLHYLHKKSYQKARLHLQGLDAENQTGNCRHV